MLIDYGTRKVLSKPSEVDLNAAFRGSKVIGHIRSNIKNQISDCGLQYDRKVCFFFIISHENTVKFGA